MQKKLDHYSRILKNIISDELEGRDSELDCAAWLIDMGLTPDELEEFGYDRLAEYARDYIKE